MRLSGDGVGLGCSKHGWDVYLSSCDECKTLRNLSAVELGRAIERLAVVSMNPGGVKRLTVTHGKLVVACDCNFDGGHEPGCAVVKAHDLGSMFLKPEKLGECSGCRYGSHCLGADLDCTCCKATVDDAAKMRYNGLNEL